MIKLFKPKYRSILGIDISSTAVSAIEISGRDDNRCVEGYGREWLPPNVVEGHVIKDIDAVAQCIKQLVLRCHLKSKFAMVAVPDSAVISKVLQVNEELNEAEIEDFIIMEADKYIPYPIEEISIDFEVIGRSIKNPTMLDVIIVASRSENVNSRVECLTKAGLQANVVDVESFAVERAAQLMVQDLPMKGQGKVIAVIDLRDEFANLFVLFNLKIIYTREDEFRSKQMTDDMMRYGVSSSETSPLKSSEKIPERYNEDVLNPFIERLVLHIKRSLQFFYSASHHGSIDHIVLAGSVATLPNLADLVEESTKIATTIANPTLHLHLSSHIDTADIFKMAPSLLIPCGLALRNIG